MALHRIPIPNNPDVTVSFVFKVHTKKGIRLTQCKLFVREDRLDAPHLIFWGRSERPEIGERHPKAEQRGSLLNAFSNFYMWVCDAFEVGSVPEMFNAVLNHRDEVIDQFEENWQKQMKNVNRGRSRK